MVIPYFCTWSSSLSSINQLLLSLCGQIRRRYKRGTSSSEQNPRHDHDDNHDELNWSCRFNRTPGLDVETSRDAPCLGLSGVVEHDLSLTELRGRLSGLLTLRPSPKQPLCLILDGLDHMDKTLWSELVSSLPTPLPPNVKVILTVSSSSSARAPVSVALSLVPLPALERKQCVKLVASLLSGSGRRVTSGQQVLVNQALSSCRLPLYARLLHWHAAVWRSGEAESTTHQMILFIVLLTFQLHVTINCCCCH